MSLIFTICLAFTASALNGDPNAGKQKSVTCNSCHGLQGISPNEPWPNLAGQKAEYIVIQLKAFKEGSRKNVLMTPMAASLSERDMEDLAAYFSQLTPGK